MSRVRKPGDKFMNSNKYDPSVTNPSKIVRIHGENEDYRKAGSLSSWLFMKYDMDYKTYRRKSKARRDALCGEYARDIGKDIGEYEGWAWDDMTSMNEIRMVSSTVSVIH